MLLTRVAIALAACALAIPCAAHASTSTQDDGGVQIIVTSPDLSPATGAPQRKKRLVAKRAAPAVVAAGSSDANRRYSGALVANAEALLGRPYVFGGATPAGFDCSGYVQYVYATIGMRIPRTADAQFAAGRKVAGDPLPGDLVFFQTYDYGASHVALYIGGGHFINAIASDVHVADFSSPYFRGRYLGARRFLPD